MSCTHEYCHRRIFALPAPYSTRCYPVDFIRLSTDLNPKGAKREQTGVHRGARTVTAYYRPILRQEETKDSQTGMHQLR
jgi:hypothetical protein